MLTKVTEAILERLREHYPQTILLDQAPAIYDSIDTPYLTPPLDGEVDIIPQISSHSSMEFTYHIYLADHQKDANRQKTIQYDILRVMQKGESIYKTCFPRFREDGTTGFNIVWKDIDGNTHAAVLDRTSYSTSTWVVTGRTYVVVQIDLHFKSYIDY